MIEPNNKWLKLFNFVVALSGLSDFILTALIVSNYDIMFG